MSHTFLALIKVSVQEMTSACTFVGYKLCFSKS